MKTLTPPATLDVLANIDPAMHLPLAVLAWLAVWLAQKALSAREFW
jgi:hypothetical protein